MILSYLFENESEKAEILNLQVFLHALSFTGVKQVGQNFWYDANARIYRGTSLKTIIRSCASRSTLGVAQSCCYFVDEVGLEVAVCVSYLVNHILQEIKSRG